MNPQVDAFLSKAVQWQKEMELLRSLVLDCTLTEELKWGVPCYTYKKSNILMIHGFKEYCALNFFKGALLKDKYAILVRKTYRKRGNYGLHILAKYIVPIRARIKAYIFEAIEIEKAGLKIPKKQTSDFGIPEELKAKFKESADFENAFNKLTEGRKRRYLLNFAQPKQSKTRIARIAQYRDRIFKGKGLNDCVCGLSQRMPGCDGSHRHVKN